MVWLRVGASGAAFGTIAERAEQSCPYETQMKILFPDESFALDVVRSISRTSEFSVP